MLIAFWTFAPLVCLKLLSNSSLKSSLIVFPIMSPLPSPSQPVFTKGISIIEWVATTLVLISFCHSSNIPCAPIKLDFSKAFNSISWDYLLTLLKTRGFNCKWLGGLTLSSKQVCSRLSSMVWGISLNLEGSTSMELFISPFVQSDNWCSCSYGSIFVGLGPY